MTVNLGKWTDTMNDIIVRLLRSHYDKKNSLDDIKTIPHTREDEISN